MVAGEGQTKESQALIEAEIKQEAADQGDLCFWGLNPKFSKQTSVSTNQLL